MPELIHAICGGAKPGRRLSGRQLRLDVSPDAPADQRVKLQLDRLTDQLVDNLPDVIADLVEIAAYVYSADRLCRRDTTVMRDMGADWRRRFQFVVPVRRLDVWARDDVSRELAATLAFLTDDDFSFTFVAAPKAPGIAAYLGFDQPAASKVVPDEVTLFSGGLDSLSGALELLTAGSKVALVTHQSATYVTHRQNALFESLATAFDRKVFYTPIRVTKGDQEPVEHTQRSRSFLFAALGCAVATMFGRRRLLFFENGITSFNLPIADHVVGTRASRTTHPRVLKDLGRLFSLLLDGEFTVENPFLWKTKADVLSVVASAGCANLIAGTTSCARVRELPMQGRQCGTCSQCIERRFAMLETGLFAQDGPDHYATDIFVAMPSATEDLTLAEYYLLRARRFATMSRDTFAASYGQVFRALGSLPGPAHDNLTRVHELHQRYGRKIVDAVNMGIRQSADVEALRTLPPAALLALMGRPGTPGVYSDPALTEPSEPPARLAFADGRRIVVALDRDGRKVLFDGGFAVGGRSYDLFAALLARYDEDLRDHRQREAFRFVGGKVLAARISLSEEGLRQQVHRTRKAIATLFAKGTNYDLDIEDVIQSSKWKGYRLNPWLLVVEPAQIASARSPSRSAGGHVTKSPPAA